MGPYEILCGIVAVILAVYYYLTKNFNFWKSRGIRGPKPIPGFGNFKDVMLCNISMGDYLTELYNTYKDERMIGIFTRTTPVLIVKDPDLIKDILIKDFSVFSHRGLPVSTIAEPLSQHLLGLEPKRWRPLRINLSPAFAPGKIKDMFSLILACADHLVQYMENIASKNEPVECRELTAKYMTDVIGSCAFGIEMKALSSEDSEFRRMGRNEMTPTWTNILRTRARQIFPWLYDMLAYAHIIPLKESTKFLTRIVVETMDYREKNNITRNDFIDILREMKKHPEKLGDIEVTDTLLASQAFLFFLGGYETSALTMSNAMYELALNQKIQDKLREEVDELYAKCGQGLTYNNVNKMDYLDKIFKEILRKYPPVTFLLRQAMSNYTFNGTTVSIPKGQRIWIPIYGMQRDPDIYPKPDVFDPERFNEEAVQSRHPMVYEPFGDGPRNCIASRFAAYQIKLGLIKVLRNYRIETCEKTPRIYVNDPKAFLLVPKYGLHLNIVKLNRP
ncbi:PREDICTED: probable cytochrome P450 6a13 isoform X1 [Vollenhovia emeryi]|uniref:probable cytochrome P450 6a13 isoform X1 n=1 Tax=Vollenhovia emeryi TaxID=411798 RepID=UPI0005F493EB|nr:PREDICTED: probable cytochrome P450 6a13 isoform X1 [Vollenhovia emeryi]XP_011862712.1 PREDICTED: probable cytochrome P450 6a13 isoform X1 [Vollenhovia emeryi]XP_011862713.1 PREDICTED: probable cytochrome P450 6a13 isoform X1 [Vollenhovia emeryi]